MSIHSDDTDILEENAWVSAVERLNLDIPKESLDGYAQNWFIANTMNQWCELIDESYSKKNSKNTRKLKKEEIVSVFVEDDMDEATAANVREHALLVRSNFDRIYHAFHPFLKQLKNQKAKKREEAEEAKKREEQVENSRKDDVEVVDLVTPTADATDQRPNRGVSFQTTTPEKMERGKKLSANAILGMQKEIEKVTSPSQKEGLMEDIDTESQVFEKLLAGTPKTRAFSRAMKDQATPDMNLVIKSQVQRKKHKKN